MIDRLSSEQKESIVTLITEFGREPLKGVIKEAIEEAEAESADSEGSGSLTPLALVSVGIGIGYALRARQSAEEFDSLNGTKARFVEADHQRDEGTDADETEEIEIETPDTEATDGGRGLLSSLLIVLGASTAIGYAVKRRFSSAEELVDEAAEGTHEVAHSTAEQTEEVTEEATGRTETLAEKAADVTSTVTDLTGSVADQAGSAGEEIDEQVAEAADRSDNEAGADGGETEA